MSEEHDVVTFTTSPLEVDAGIVICRAKSNDLRPRAKPRNARSAALLVMQMQPWQGSVIAHVGPNVAGDRFALRQDRHRGVAGDEISIGRDFNTHPLAALELDLYGCQSSRGASSPRRSYVPHHSRPRR